MADTPRIEKLLKYIADAFVASPGLANPDRFEAMREIKARLSAPSDLLRQLVLDCQNDLATYIVPDSGISEHDVVNTLLGRLDGPQARAALSTPSEKRWIPVSERKPDANDGRVLILIASKDVAITNLVTGGHVDLSGYWWAGVPGNWINVAQQRWEVTHWMPRPKDPT